MIESRTTQKALCAEVVATVPHGAIFAFGGAWFGTLCFFKIFRVAAGKNTPTCWWQLTVVLAQMFFCVLTLVLNYHVVLTLLAIGLTIFILKEVGQAY